MPPSLTSRISCLSPIFHAFPSSPLSSHLFTSAEEEGEMNEPCWTQTIMFAPFLPSPPTAETPLNLKRPRATRPTREAYSSLRFGSFLLRLRFLHLLINLNEGNESLHISGRGCFGSQGIRHEVNKKSRAASSLEEALARRVTSTLGWECGSS